MEMIEERKIIFLVDQSASPDYLLLTAIRYPHYTHDTRGVAQLVAHRVWDAGVSGSSPLTPTNGQSKVKREP
jgi:hypothetical protein